MSSTEKRKGSLIKYLINKEHFVTAREISETLGISSKTVYRMITEINEDSPEKNIIISQHGKGYLLNYPEYIKWKDDLKDEGPNGSPEDRRKSITKLLLFKSPNPISIMTLCEKFYVSESVINADERIISDTLKDYNLELVRENRKLSIIGNEGNIRSAIAQLILDDAPMDQTDFYNHEEEINQEYMSFALKQIDYIEKVQNSSIPYPYNINISSHLYIMIKRLIEGDMKGDYSEEYSINDQQLIQSNLEMFELAMKIIDNIRSRYSVHVPNAEVLYLFQYLISSRIDTKYVDDIRYSPLTFEVTNYYIARVFQKLGVQTTNSEGVLRDIIKHVQPMINRINHGILIKNHLIDEIEHEYKAILTAVEEVSKEVEEKFHFNKISKAESGFLTLYFAKYYEKNPRKIHALIMCTTGIGTSELLKTKVKKVFPEIEIVDVVSTRMLEDYDHEAKHVDIIITTIHVENQLDIPEVLVSALFTEHDQVRVRNVIGSLT
ncbi:BglG family transcription antiterminator [Niallia sp. Krafla_26]|uniref:BglG family transcription antiterminator n=1 Tax=Niallia sp. Krafla_26 TaxID=3064703 RepID=UPI003D17C7AD